MACKKYQLINTGATNIYVTFRRCDDGLYEYNKEIPPFRIYNLWVLDDTLVTAEQGQFTLEDEGTFPPPKPSPITTTTTILPTPTPSFTPTTTITPTPTSTPSFTPTTTITPTPTTTPIQEITDGLITGDGFYIQTGPDEYLKITE